MVEEIVSSSHWRRLLARPGSQHQLRRGDQSRVHHCTEYLRQELCIKKLNMMQETAGPLPSPSNAFLIDAVNASGLAGTPGPQSLMRTAGSMSEGHTTLIQTISEHPDGGAGSDVDAPPGTATNTSLAYNADAPVPTLNSAFTNLTQTQPHLQLPPSALLPGPDGVLPGTAPQAVEQSDRHLPQQPVARTLSKGGTPRSLPTADSGVPPVAEPEVPGTATSKTPGRSAFLPSSMAAGAEGSTSAGPPASVSASVASVPKKKKASDMSKAERRALQEEQRSKKLAAKELQGAHPLYEIVSAACKQLFRSCIGDASL